MADPEHLEILKQGVEVWNEWRLQDLEISPDLSEADLNGANLSKANLSRANLCGANLSEANLKDAMLSDADLIRADLRRADLTGARLRGARLIEAKLIGASLKDANMRGAILDEADFTGADLRGAGLFGADLKGTNLSGANLYGVDLGEARLMGADLSRAALRRANLTEVNLKDAILYETDLRATDLIRANLSGADLRRVDLTGANLEDAILYEADLREAVLIGTSLSKADFSDASIATVFGDVDLSQVIGLETVSHEGASTIGIDTIYRSQGRIPEVFLQRAGVPDSFISYMRSLVIQPIEFYSCFISYSSKDQDFVERLYTDLQAKNVRCWFAPEDMQIGDRIRDRIEQSIRVYDKLLLVLSQHSIHSEWVEIEVETAFERERQWARAVPEGADRPTVLFPVRLDETVNETSLAWARSIHRTRHIGDFSNWKDHDSYQKAFARLLRDLTAAERKAKPEPR